MAIASPLDPGSSKSKVRTEPLATHYAPAERTSPAELRQELTGLTDDPVIDALLRSVSGLVAVLNRHRQVLALNVRMLELLGVTDATKVLGLRLGEAVGCNHAHATPGGCGTSEFCSTCGAAIAMMSSAAHDLPVERVCAIELEQPIAGSDHLYFRVQVCPLRRGASQLQLIFIQDITDEQRRATLERTFFHDVKNTLCAMLAAGEMLADHPRPADAKLATTLLKMTQRLAREIELQRCLVSFQTGQFERQPGRVEVDRFLDELIRSCEHHPVATNRKLELASPTTGQTLESDETLLLRVVQNMVINALEATAPGGTVRIRFTTTADGSEFGVWNDGAMPPDVARRVFQRNFSTKGSLGRGLGTYSMKLLGENLLGGRVGFTSNAADGTWFRLLLPPRASRPGPAKGTHGAL